MKKSHIIILVIALLGGGAYAALEYWDDIAPLIGLAPETTAVAVRTARTDTAAAAAAVSSVEEYQGKVGEILSAIAEHEGRFLYGDNVLGYEATIAKLKISYPAGLKRQNVDATGKVLWARTDDWAGVNWRMELKGKPVG